MAGISMAGMPWPAQLSLCLAGPAVCLVHAVLHAAVHVSDSRRRSQLEILQEAHRYLVESSALAVLNGTDSAHQADVIRAIMAPHEQTEATDW
jgi:hypothetical protein